MSNFLKDRTGPALNERPGDQERTESESQSPAEEASAPRVVEPVPPASFATRANILRTEGIGKSKLLLLGGGLAVAVLFFSFTAVVGKSSKKHALVTPQAQQQKGEAKPAKGSLTPLMETVRPQAPDNGGGQLGPADIRRTRATDGAASLTPGMANAKATQPSKPAAGPPLASVPTFADTQQRWEEPKPYAEQNAPPIVATGNAIQSQQQSSALKETSLVFVRNQTQTLTGGVRQLETQASTAPFLDVKPGTRVQAKLETQISSAMQAPVVAIVEYTYAIGDKIVLPAGARVYGQLQQADRSGLVSIKFDEVELLDGAREKIDAIGTGLDLGPLHGTVSGTNAGRNFMVRAASGVGSLLAQVAGTNTSAAFSEQDILRQRVAENTTIEADAVMLEGSKTSFSRCLKVLLGRDYEQFDAARRQSESNLLNGPAVDGLLTRFESFFAKAPTFRLTEDLEASIGNRLSIQKRNQYQPIHRSPQVQYYFNAARTKSNPYPWLGLTKYGPFSRDTFAKTSPAILVVLPEAAQGAVETFLKTFKEGMPSQSQFEGGFAKLFGLVNPTLSLCKVRFSKNTTVAASYCEAIEEHLAASSTTPDAAIVVLHDAHGDLPDETNPYLRAKASLMMLGIPTQEIRVSRLTRSGYELQNILQNFSVALYAKMNGTPWTVNQDTTISDELIIGLGTIEVSASRFDRRTRYVGVTTVFRGDGNYLLGHVSKECSYDEYPEMLKDTTERVLTDIKARNGWAPGDNVRMIFHTYKPLKNVEVAEIVKRAAHAVGNEQTIEFAFLTVTIDHPFLVLDRNQSGITVKTWVKGVYVPDRGTIVQIGKYTRLVCTNGAQLMKHKDAPLPSPLLVHIHKGSTFHDLTYLSEQILKFTGLSWRSTLPAKRPVTIYYSELIANLLGRLRAVPDWSPTILNVKLRASRWFL